MITSNSDYPATPGLAAAVARVIAAEDRHAARAAEERRRARLRHRQAVLGTIVAGLPDDEIAGVFARRPELAAAIRDARTA